ncbi:MAG: hypothetical protein IIW70_03070 [Bacteroidales bacterium]|nr:hypothetical protein [Bacteroidales bacterium]
MKKYFLSIVALAGMLFATSCQESLVEPQVGGPTTFTIEIPGQMGTKAGDNSYKLFVEVYSEDGNTKIHRLEDVITVGEAKTVSLNLVATQVYDIIFWAQKADASYDARNLNKVEITNKHHNSENGAAFYAIKNDYKPVEVNNPSVTLKRPFAQLNIGTIDEVSYGDNNGNKKLEILSTKIKVESAAKYFERINTQDSPELGEGTTEVVFEYEGGNVLTSTMTIGEGANAKTYKQVSMDYISVLGNRDAVTVTATIKVKDPNGVESTIERVITNVPLQMNFRTNIVGNLITSTSDFTVTIDERWDGTDINKEVEFREVATAEELQDAIEEGVDNITLTADIELTDTLEFRPVQGPNPIARTSTNETSFVLDLGGKKITTSEESVGRHKYAIYNYANLTIIGEGEIIARGIKNFGTMTIDGNITITNVDTNGGAAIWNEGNITINAGTFISGNPDIIVEGSYGAALNTRPSEEKETKAIVNGGTFIAYSQLTYAIINEGETIINNAIVKGRHGAVAGAESDDNTKIYGGSFELMENPKVSDHCTYYLSSIYGGQFTLGKNTDSGAKVFYESHIAAGYHVEQSTDGKTYFVLPDTADVKGYDLVITDPAQLTREVLTNNDDILLQLSTGEHTIELYMDMKDEAELFDANLTIIGTNGTKVKFANQQVILKLVNNFTIKNCEILRMPKKDWGMLVFSTGNKAEGVYTIENCTFKGVGTQGIYINEEKTGATYNIIDCTFNGDFGVEGAITIQPNKDVEHIVNVKRCEFNNIPATSHRIFLAPYDGKKALFYGFTLDTDLKATTAYELEMFLALGQAQLGCNLTFSAKETSANSGYGATGVKVAGGSVLDGQGHTLIVNDAWGTWDCVVAAKGGRIENLTVSGAMRGIFMPGADGDVYIDNVIFDNVIYTFNSDAGNKNYGVYISNSTLNGWTSHSDVHKEVVYTNCKFGEGNGYAFCRPYGPTSFVGCDFEAGFEVDAIGQITFENCTIGGVALTDENLATLVKGGIANATVK